MQVDNVGISLLEHLLNLSLEYLQLGEENKWLVPYKVATNAELQSFQENLIEQVAVMLKPIVKNYQIPVAKVM